jgi:hypothetical protein
MTDTVDLFDLVSGAYVEPKAERKGLKVRNLFADDLYSVG